MAATAAQLAGAPPPGPPLSAARLAADQSLLAADSEMFRPAAGLPGQSAGAAPRHPSVQRFRPALAEAPRGDRRIASLPPAPQPPWASLGLETDVGTVHAAPPLQQPLAPASVVSLLGAAAQLCASPRGATSPLTTARAAATPRSGVTGLTEPASVAASPLKSRGSLGVPPGTLAPSPRVSSRACSREVLAASPASWENSRPRPMLGVAAGGSVVVSGSLHTASQPSLHAAGRPSPPEAGAAGHDRLGALAAVATAAVARTATAAVMATSVPPHLGAPPTLAPPAVAEDAPSHSAIAYGGSLRSPCPRSQPPPASTPRAPRSCLGRQDISWDHLASQSTPGTVVLGPLTGFAAFSPPPRCLARRLGAPVACGAPPARPAAGAPPPPVRGEHPAGGRRAPHGAPAPSAAAPCAEVPPGAAEGSGPSERTASQTPRSPVRGAPVGADDSPAGTPSRAVGLSDGIGGAGSPGPRRTPVGDISASPIDGKVEFESTVSQSSSDPGGGAAPEGAAPQADKAASRCPAAHAAGKGQASDDGAAPREPEEEAATAEGAILDLGAN
ncbi:unnamed protein product [Prorocentrum cordatum]|uniref:Uncharacterized protein n=1 Tax=Prorocentrum cordatum TaxID=2364126 RepID=A0ABN9UPA3_9DINO|nr:unnamed protein product [Polarella glacialis]